MPVLKCNFFFFFLSRESDAIISLHQRALDDKDLYTI